MYVACLFTVDLMTVIRPEKWKRQYKNKNRFLGSVKKWRIVKDYPKKNNSTNKAKQTAKVPELKLVT